MFLAGHNDIVGVGQCANGFLAILQLFPALCKYMTIKQCRNSWNSKDAVSL